MKGVARAVRLEHSALLDQEPGYRHPGDYGIVDRQDDK